MNTLRSDDGTPLEVQEGILLDQENRPVYQSTVESPKFRVRRVGPGLLIAMAALVPVFIVAGFAIFAIFFAVFLLFWILRSLARAFR